jgi:molecular chaperone GrpE
MTDADPTPVGAEPVAEADVDVEVESPEAPELAEDDAHRDEADARASVEELIADLERTVAERDEYLDLARRTQAEFENYRKRVATQQADEAERVAASLVEQLLPVLDACDGAIAHGAAEVEPIFAALLQTLEKGGLVRIQPAGAPFDPTEHEAVLHEPAADGDDGTVVSDVMRPGYSWKGRVVRPAMVKVRG